MAKLWGNWCLDYRGRCLLLCDGHGNALHRVDLTAIRDAAGMLDAIFGFQAQAQATPDAQANLLRALREIFDTQTNLCQQQLDNFLAKESSSPQRRYRYRSTARQQRPAIKGRKNKRRPQ